MTLEGACDDAASRCQEARAKVAANRAALCSLLHAQLPLAGRRFAEKLTTALPGAARDTLGSTESAKIQDKVR